MKLSLRNKLVGVKVFNTNKKVLLGAFQHVVRLCLLRHFESL